MISIKKQLSILGSKTTKNTPLEKPDDEWEFPSEWTVKEIIDQFEQMANQKDAENKLSPKLFKWEYKKATVWKVKKNLKEANAGLHKH